MKDNLRLSPYALMDAYMEDTEKWREESSEDDATEEDYGDDDGTVGQSGEQLFKGLRRYFPDVDDRTSSSALCLMRCVLFRSGDLVNGFAVIHDERFLTFTDEDCLVADIRRGQPRAGLLKDISECSVQNPSGFRIPSTTYVRVNPSPSPSTDSASIILTFGEGDVAGDEALLASSGIGRGRDQQQIAENTIGKFITFIDAAMGKNKGAPGSGKPSSR